MKKRTFTILAIALITISSAFAQKDEKKRSKFNMNALNEMMQGRSMPGMNAVEVEAEYQFEHSVDMKVMSYNKKGNLDNTMEYTMHLEEDSEYFGMETTHENMEMKMVYELKNSRMVMMTLSDGNKMGFVNVIDDELLDEEHKDDNMDFQKTGREKTILGRNCEEWTGSDDGGEYTAWLTTDATFSFAEAYQEMAKAQNKGKGPSRDYPEGMLMEMTSTDTKTGTKTIMTVIAIRENSNATISTVGWTFYQIGG